MNSTLHKIVPSFKNNESSTNIFNFEKNLQVVRQIQGTLVKAFKT